MTTNNICHFKGHLEVSFMSRLCAVTHCIIADDFVFLRGTCSVKFYKPSPNWNFCAVGNVDIFVFATKNLVEIRPQEVAIPISDMYRFGTSASPRSYKSFLAARRCGWSLVNVIDFHQVISERATPINGSRRCTCHITQCAYDSIRVKGVEGIHIKRQHNYWHQATSLPVAYRRIKIMLASNTSECMPHWSVIYRRTGLGFDILLTSR